MGLLTYQPGTVICGKLVRLTPMAVSDEMFAVLKNKCIRKLLDQVVAVKHAPEQRRQLITIRHKGR